MLIDALPARFVAVSDGLAGGREHVVLHLEVPPGDAAFGFALSLPDAVKLLAVLTTVVPRVVEIQQRLTEAN